ncbi:iron dicitrate transport regulator FecR [Leptospira semungkisensis]|uniref:Iron dicitrate transport regulator FecR n=1 Tax=Leptospira semungkisensis TaxID=2484985 RepID=A0A4R9FND0_9LEPT|nr:FecR domain-containing protein [Leptospira semungkisensis]TGJ99764.1 iron dicitrate transport regulator FecR [Leptospira semungkisensis]
MKKMLRILLILNFALFLSLGCDKAKSDRKRGIVTFVSGNVSIERGDQKIKVGLHQELQNGDVVETEDKSTAVITFGENSILVEVQSNSKFRFTEKENEKLFIQEKGSTWLSTSKLLKGEGVSLHTPTVTAGVRGTSFYTGVVEDMTMICHCEGHVELENNENHAKKTNDSDYLAVTRGSKTIYLTPADLHKENVPYGHDHSELSDSPLGRKNPMSLKEFQTVIALAKKKLDSTP